MKAKQRTTKTSLWIALVLAAWITGAVPSAVFGQKKERPVLPKPAVTKIDSQAAQTDVIVVKFREGTGVRLRNDRWAASLGARSFDDQRLLQRANLDEAQVLGELEAANALLQSNANLAVARLFSRPEDELDVEKQVGEQTSNEELADLNLYYHVFLDNAAVEDTEALIDQLNALEIVEIAYPQPIYRLAQAPPTGDYTSEQRYFSPNVNPTPLLPGSNGLDVNYAWTLAGGKGQNVRVIDIEFDWRDGHEDLPGLFYNSGARSGVMNDRSHGSAVLGVIAGRENTFGINGMAPQVQGIGISHPNRLRICFPPPCRLIFDAANAINAAAAQLTAGDVILIEVQVGGPRSGLTCTCNCTQFEMVPVEYNQAEYDAIRAATVSRLLVVVEAAGNGSMNLDDARYGGRFNRSDSTRPDSFAIMVGAGGSGTPGVGGAPARRGAWCWTNSGSRLDVQGWGDSVTTAGYGDRFGAAQGLPETRWYTSTFSGTSSASAIITGAAANVQGVRRTRGLTPLSSFQMRSLLRQTGVAQAAGRQIGPLPNLRDAIALYVDGSSAIFAPVGTPSQPYRRVTDAVNAAWNQAQIKIRAGTYREGSASFSRPTIWTSTGGTVTIQP